MSDRPTCATDNERLRIKRLTKLAVDDAGHGGVAATAIGRSKGQISKYCHAHYPETIPLDAAITLDRLADEPTLIPAACEMIGGRFLPAPGQIDDRPVGIEDLTAIITETNDVTSRLSAYLADGVDRIEAIHLLPEVREAIIEFRRLERKLISLAAGERGEA